MMSTVFSIILVFIHFKLILESCTTSGVYLGPYQTFIMRNALLFIFGKVLNEALQPRFSALRLALSSFGYLNEYINILFFF